jgi:NAD(P)-dependent dehydrogenase (short-subunit alcohol dehydrogenase family)
MDLAEVEGIESSLGALQSAQNVTVEAFVHCAGMLKIARFRSLAFETAVQTMNVNFLSAVAILRSLLGRANRQQLRNVVFISSTASQFGARGFNMYCASKGALDALMRALAVELAPAVRVNSVLPGGVRTEMTASMFEDPEIKERIQRDYPLGIGEPEDIASAVEFLLSDRSRWITGQQLVVDGGRTVNITA